MDIVLLLAIASLSNIACFVIGAKVGQAVTKGDPVETPTVNPFKAYQERKERKEAEFEQSRIDTIMRNIENYDGTGYGQEEVPRG